VSRSPRAVYSEPLPLDLLEPPIRGLILDMDGVLWKETQPIGDLAVVFAAISRRKLAVTVATNNAMKTVAQCRAKLNGFGVDLEPSQIITSAEATADTLAGAFSGGSVFVVGERGLLQALEERGFEAVTDPKTDRSYVAVVVGLDRALTYLSLQKAATLVRAGAPFFATNPDKTFPTPEGLVPGAGAVLAAIAAASGSLPTVIGKPSPLLFQIAATRMQLAPESILVVGDRLETDVAGGQAFGARTALVLTGVSSEAEAQAWTPPPTMVAPSLGALLSP